jgi:hypothetical protein
MTSMFIPYKPMNFFFHMTIIAIVTHEVCDVAYDKIT